MGIYRLNATREGDLLSADGGAGWRRGLERALGGLGPGAPVCIMIHGFRYTWNGRAAPACACPHARLYAGTPVPPSARIRPERSAWPEALGFAREGSAAGLAIGYGWEARTPFMGLTGLASVYERAAFAGRALTRLVEAVAERRPDLTVDVLAHSLGARVALKAAASRPDLPFGRMIFLGAAEFTGPAREAMRRLDARGSGAEVYHMLGRANDAYDALFGVLAPRPEEGDRPLGLEGLGVPCRRWLDVQIDHPEVARWLAGRGIALERADSRLSHWHFYADPGAMALYRRILRERRAHSVEALSAAGLPRAVEPRWSRLLPAPRSVLEPADSPEPVAELTRG